MKNSNSSNTQSAQWDGLDGKDGNCIFEADGYHAIQGQGNIHACQETLYSYSDAAITVDVKINNGDSGGILLRFNKDFWGQYSGYLFEINSEGQYKFSNFDAKLTLQDWASSPDLHAGYGALNTLEVIMQGNTFFLYANGGYLTTVTDNSSSTHPSGNVALVASSPNADTDVDFSNIFMYPSRS